MQKDEGTLCSNLRENNHLEDKQSAPAAAVRKAGEKCVAGQGSGIFSDRGQGAAAGRTAAAPLVFREGLRRSGVSLKRARILTNSQKED